MEITQADIEISKSVGLVETKFFTFVEKLKLESDAVFGPITVAYETYGELNKTKDNAVLVLHALTGDAHAAGYHSPSDKKPGWWDIMIGPGKAIDTNKYFVICSNILGGCKGTTGPSSINPETAKPYGLTFPIVTIQDMVEVQKKLVDYLDVTCLHSVIGGSMGGMQAMQWTISYPDFVKSSVVVASTGKLSAQGIAFNAVGRNAILSDVNWSGGDYYGKEMPSKGLSVARMVGHITYLCEEAMHSKFGREFQNAYRSEFAFAPDFQVESYLQHQGEVFVDRFDANSYLYITKAVDYFDIQSKYGSLAKAFKETSAKFLVISFSSDWLFPSAQSKEIVKGLMSIKKDVSYCEIDSPCGHDAFLLEHKTQSRIISSFLNDMEMN